VNLIIFPLFYLFFISDSLFSYVIDWNTNTRHSTEAQIVIKILLSIVSPDKILKLPNGQKCVESLLPYTGKIYFYFLNLLFYLLERHMSRIDRLSQQVLFLDFSWHSMKYLDQSRYIFFLLLPNSLFCFLVFHCPMIYKQQHRCFVFFFRNCYAMLFGDFFVVIILE
jgi:hypothetical protein